MRLHPHCRQWQSVRCGVWDAVALSVALYYREDLAQSLVQRLEEERLVRCGAHSLAATGGNTLGECVWPLEAAAP